MKLLTHLLFADVRRFWTIIAAWLLVVAAGTIIDGVRPLLASDPRVLSLVGITGTLLWLTEVLLFVVLIALAVQTHLLVGTDAFWMTRPIPPQTLFASKLVLLGLVVVAAPVIADIVLMRAYHVPATENALVGIATLLMRTSLLVVLMTAAALTRNFSRFALLCGTVVGGAALLLSAVATIEMMRTEYAHVSLSVSPGPMTADDDPTGGVVSMVLLTMVGFAVLAILYRTRSRLRAIMLGVAGVFLASAITYAWPWPALQPPVSIPPWATAGSMLRLSADPGTVESRDEMAFGRRSAWQSIRARVHLTGIEPAWSATVALMSATIQVNDKTTLTTARRGFPAAVPIDRDEQYPTRVATQNLLGVRRLTESVPPTGESPVVFMMPDEQSRGLEAATGLYRGRFLVALTHHEIEAVLPLRAGASHQNGSYRIVLDGVEPTAGSVSVYARESQARSPFDRTPRSMVTFYLRNRAEGDAVAGNLIDVRDGTFFFPFGGISASVEQSDGFVARASMIRFPPSYGVQGKPLTLDARWLAGAELIIVRTTREGSVQRELEMPGFQIGPPSIG